jgi:hypothetical protein
MSEQAKTEVADGVMMLNLQRPDKTSTHVGAVYNALSEALERADTGVPMKGPVSGGKDSPPENDLADFAAQASGPSVGHRLYGNPRVRLSLSSPPRFALNAAGSCPVVLCNS